MKNKNACDNKKTEESLASQLKCFGPNWEGKTPLKECHVKIYTRVNEIIVEFDKLQKKEVHQFLIQAERDYISGSIEQKGLLFAFELTLSYLFRRVLMGKPRSGMRNFLIEVHRQAMKNKEKKGYEASLRDAILMQPKTPTSAFPSDEEVNAKLLKERIHNDKKIKETTYLLLKLELYKTPSRKIEKDNFQIEHVLPKRLRECWRDILGEDFEKLHKDYLNTLGNLTLTFDNTALSNHCFNIKKPVFSKDETFNLNKYFPKLDIWDVNAIEHRGAILAKDVLKIWANPDVVREQVRDIKLE